MSDCSIVILNYNGRELLKTCLPSIEEAVDSSRFSCNIVVLDNQSADDSEAFVRQFHPRVRFVKSGGNRVLCSYNEYLRQAPEEIAILLNNDLRVERNFIDPLITELKAAPEIFFTAPRVLNYETKAYEGSRSKMQFSWGLLWGNTIFPGYKEKILDASLTMQCGFGAFRRSAFLELNGYDDLYLPGTVEDSDLCFRAYRKGWKGRYCPESVVYHMGQATFRKSFGTSGIRRINRRNLYLFVWKNIRSPFLLLEHFLCLPLQLVKYCVKGEFDFLKGFWDAVKIMPQALQRRRLESKVSYPVSDRAVFACSRSL